MFGCGKGGDGRGFISLAAAPRAALRSLHRQADGQDEHRAVEEGLHEEGGAQLVEPGDRDREDGNSQHRSPDIHASRPDRGCSEQGRREGDYQLG